MFKSMLENNFSERLEIISFPTLSVEIVQLIDDFLETGTLKVNGDNFHELMNAADYLIMPTITLACEEFLIEAIKSHYSNGIYSSKPYIDSLDELMDLKKIALKYKLA